ncbi:hypothetical protein chiPu_0017102 [Chiloscyllium punctatum]|uniref:Uncharacterized protein n=1 Tax=Chiloscyllium punctatum TaxID=137246 RepID=A0A401T7L3_CHIPU|nr:hypothetical protein [Chiloscyllium punctatum]
MAVASELSFSAAKRNKAEKTCDGCEEAGETSMAMSNGNGDFMVQSNGSVPSNANGNSVTAACDGDHLSEQLSAKETSRAKLAAASSLSLLSSITLPFVFIIGGLTISSINLCNSNTSPTSDLPGFFDFPEGEWFKILAMLPVCMTFPGQLHSDLHSHMCRALLSTLGI